jgi:hypothetical protein
MEDALGPLEGVRMWIHQDERLLGLNGAEWAIQTCAAECSRHFGESGHRAPEFECTCGYYAAADQRTLFPDPGGEFTAFWDGSVVMGPVKGWGLAVPYTCGWRAEFAKPLGLYELAVPPIPQDAGSVVIKTSTGEVEWVYQRRRGRSPSPLTNVAEMYGIPLLIPPYELRELVWARVLEALHRKKRE